MPSSDYVNFAHMIIDMGADIYWGHSNHTPQGIEIYKQNKVIMYDCGDFMDDYAVDPVHRNDLSFLFLLNFECSKNKNNTSSSNSSSSNYCMIRRASSNKQNDQKMQLSWN
jgi:poly-gamma-glutamate capsule biosynthesis protein CapA/YwtB (metallophosphatase superfamily)